MHRKAKNQLIDVDWCEDRGIRIIGVADGTDTASEQSKLIITVKAAVAEDFSNNLSKNTRSALLTLAKEGKHLGGTPPLGLKVNDDQTYDIDETTAPIIRDIYKLYLQDMGYSYIIQYLKDRGYTTSEGHDFSKASLNAILRNPKYKGTYVYDRTAPKDSEGKRNSNAVKDEYIEIDDIIPPIISAEDFEKVQAKMKENATKHTHRASSNYYALSGKIKCAVCGKAVNGCVNYSKGKKYLQYRGTCNCKQKSIRTNRLNDLTFYAMQQCLFSPENKEQIISIMNQKLQVEAHKKSAEVAKIKKKIDELNVKQAYLTAEIENGRATKTLMTKMEDNEAELAGLIAQLEAKTKEFSAIDDATYESLVKQFYSYMGTQKTPQAVDLRNAVIDRIESDDSKTTIFFHPGVTVDQETIDFFNNGKDWEDK